MTKMRAKMVVASAVKHSDTCEALTFRAVCKADGYPADGTDENNSFALWTPSADLNMTVTNPALIGQFQAGDAFYVDFIEAPK